MCPWVLSRVGYVTWDSIYNETRVYIDKINAVWGVTYGIEKNWSTCSYTGFTFFCLFQIQIDRSPCGSGVTSRIALLYAKGHIQLGQARHFENAITGGTFTAKPTREVRCGERNGVIVEVSGRAFYTGTSTFTHEEDDHLGRGFILK